MGGGEGVCLLPQFCFDVAQPRRIGGRSVEPLPELDAMRDNTNVQTKRA
jgi:hypothetical protein|tara:strand:+ start:8012 stop:8158 length:147 start_codon:yes stop_codon:yes gene_type:complete